MQIPIDKANRDIERERMKSRPDVLPVPVDRSIIHCTRSGDCIALHDLRYNSVRMRFSN